MVLAMTQATVHLEFAERERRDLQDGIDSSLHAEISPSMLIANGLELEDQQRRLCADRKTSSQNPTDNQKAKIQTHSNALQCKLDAWIQVQTLYMPAVASLRLRAQHDDSPQHEMPEDFVDDALNDVRQNVCLHAHLNIFKTLHVRGQRRQKKCASRLKYEAACAVLDKLGDCLAGQSEGRCDIPWIWKALGVLQNNDVDLQDCLCVEWCKARARASCWSEEFSLLIEEMQRVLAFFRWEMTQWNEQSIVPSFTKDADREGSIAYAERQVSVREGLVARFLMLWSGTLSAVISKFDLVPEIDNKAEDPTPSLEGPPLQRDDE
ncbi:hypothetical protein EDB19DRAFT_2027845 [Suillus lakei]|nr:hypothetical protein EDB19DRAFT_2027845 [Suillus lakei]